MKTKITLLAVAAVVINTAWISPASSPAISIKKETKISTAVAEPGFSFSECIARAKTESLLPGDLTPAMAYPVSL